ncbi:kappa-casein-like [Apodemus sylvaticus]|uniref:kappa-casein-like n=1 Tax=Apodemus sylvaticus TaxID=10129 RepID=UPI002242C131|nr:kappa-casein-like [Apodemus sylvaticus]
MALGEYKRDAAVRRLSSTTEDDRRVREKELSGEFQDTLNKMKALLLLSAILALSACLPVPEEQEREKRSASDSDELPIRISFPPYEYPFGAYPRFFYQGYPWYYYPYYNPLSVPFAPRAIMRNFIIVMNILALTLPFLAAEVQNPDSNCREKNKVVYDEQRVQYTPVRSFLSRNYYEPNYYQYRSPVPVSPYMYYPFVVKLFLLRSPAPISKWQPMPNFPQPVGVPHALPSPSFLAIPTNENQDNTAIPTINPITPTVSTPVSTTESVTNTVANPEASTVSVNIPETATVPVSSPAA